MKSFFIKIFYVPILLFAMIHLIGSSDLIEIKKERIQLKTIENLCPTTLVRGDLEFSGNGPRVFGSILLKLDESKKQIIAEVRFSAQETIKDSLTGISEVKGFWKIPVYKTPRGYYIKSFENTASETKFTKVLKKKNNAKDNFIHVLKDGDGLNGKGGVDFMQIVGDIDGVDISTSENNCKNHTRIFKIIFKPIEIEMIEDKNK